MSYKNNNRGFTIIELLIATAVFSVILLGATAVLIQVSKMYYKGIVSARTQQVARNVADAVSRPIQLQGSNQREQIDSYFVNGTWSVSVKCVGNQRFTYVTGMQVDGSLPDGSTAGDHIRHVLWRDTLDPKYPCVAVDLSKKDPSQGSDGTNGEDLLTEKMRLVAFDILRPGPGLWFINVDVLYGDRDLMLPVDQTILPETCRGGVVGSQWCAHAQYETQVRPRL